MIRDKLISHIYASDPAVERNTIIAFSLIEAKGFLDKSEFLQLTNAEIPIISILSNILRLDASGVKELIDERKISYPDMLCVLGIFAQDYSVQRQRR